MSVCLCVFVCVCVCRVESHGKSPVHYIWQRNIANIYLRGETGGRGERPSINVTLWYGKPRNKLAFNPLNPQGHMSLKLYSSVPYMYIDMVGLTAWKSHGLTYIISEGFHPTLCHCNFLSLCVSLKFYFFLIV